MTARIVKVEAAIALLPNNTPTQVARMPETILGRSKRIIADKSISSHSAKRLDRSKPLQILLGTEFRKISISGRFASKQPGQIEFRYLGTALGSTFEMQVDPTFTGSPWHSGRQRRIRTGTIIDESFYGPTLPPIETRPYGGTFSLGIRGINVTENQNILTGDRQSHESSHATIRPMLMAIR